ncbi:MED7-domain-containing protein [Xylaria sp. CBS 124048]|nr:MED7-domain-containing protein [Xylaria sp. CBS 124048]
MDEEQQQQHQQVSSTWPAPPLFWKDFTPSNIARIDQIREETAERLGIQDSRNVRLDDLPRQLRNLQPPPEPENGSWRLFGGTYWLTDELPPLEDADVRRLFPAPEERDQDGKHFDRATILKRLAKSLLLNFLELTGLLALSPEAANDKINDLRDLFINFHHLINEYRPHQARESLISMMQSQLDRTRAETNSIRDAKDKAERVLEGLGSLTIEDTASGMTSEETDHYRPEADAWALILE